MSQRHLIRVEPDVLERMAYQSGENIELAKDHAYLIFGSTTYVAPLAGEAA